jgi:hypothetical protein
LAGRENAIKETPCLEGNWYSENERTKK